MTSLNGLTDVSEIREQLLKLLKHGFVEVKFKKSDGTDRTMRCTLLPDFLPQPTASSGSRHISEESLPVWDVDNDGWRSFRIDSLISYEVINRVF